MNVRQALFKGFDGCTDHGCVIAGKREGMGTNGGCRCLRNLNQVQLGILSSRLQVIAEMELRPAKIRSGKQ